MIHTSPSQYQTFQKLCPRKWWFRYVHGLEEPKKPSQNFGSAVHKIIERYLSADATGRDKKTGKPVELYPEGWAAEYKILPTEQATIRALITEAIENGVLYRPQGDYAVEREYFWKIPGGLALEHGYCDLMEESAIVDHKTHSSSRWALSAEEIQTDLQMRCYASELRRVYIGQEKEPPKEIRLRHNVFIWKNNPKTFAREAIVTSAELDAHEEKIAGIVQEMVGLRSKKMVEWESVPDSPRPHSDACNAYGGCPYRGICSKGERPDQYKLRMINLNKTPEQIRKELIPMRGSLLDSIKAKPATPPPAVPLSTPAAVVPPPPFVGVGMISEDEKNMPLPPAMEKATAIPGVDAAPWYQTEPPCKACSANPVPGFDSRGRPCRICEAKAGYKGQRKPESYQFGIGDDGLPFWQEKEGAPIAAAPEVQEEEQEEQEETEEMIATAATQTEAPRRRGRPPGSKNKSATPTAPAVQTTVVPTPVTVESRTHTVIADTTQVLTAIEGLSKKLDQFIGAFNTFVQNQSKSASIPVSVEGGFTIVIGASHHQPGVWLHSFLRPLQDELAAHKNAQNYFLLPAFDRRDALCAVMPGAVARLEGQVLLAPPYQAMSPDEIAVLAVLRGLAREVIGA